MNLTGLNNIQNLEINSKRAKPYDEGVHTQAVITSRFVEIYNSTSKAALAFIIAKCGKTDDINDILQDTYLELYQLLVKRGADYVTNEKALVFRIARQKISKYYSLAERLRALVPLNRDDDDSETDIEDTSISLEDIAINRELLDNAQEFIQSKSEAVKKVFALYYSSGLTIPEIAKSLLMSESNVKQKLYRTLKELRKLLNEK